MFIEVLGSAQDGGIPHFACRCRHCAAARKDATRSRGPASLAIVDGARVFVIDASPDFHRQAGGFIARMSPPRLDRRKPLDGVLLTHSHYGHYPGLAALGTECVNADSIPVYCSEAMADFLSENKPFSRLAEEGQIRLVRVAPGERIALTENLAAFPFLVPHRRDDSDTFGYRILGRREAVYIPDIDALRQKEAETIRAADVALIDGTFYDPDELGGRDIRDVPHPLIPDSMKILGRPENEIYFTHFNHTNAAAERDSEATKAVRAAGFGLAWDGMRVEL